MGILAEPAQFIRDLKLHRGFDVLELGDQFITHGTRRLAKEFYQELGCNKYACIDGNGRNGAFTHDLNQPLRLAMKYDLVTDFGTGEHVFNQRAVWQTIHYHTKVGGHIVFDRPIAGYPGHCYYLIQPALIHDIASANEYEIIRLEEADTKRGRLIRGVLQRTSKTKWRDPQMGRYRKLLRPITEPKNGIS